MSIVLDWAPPPSTWNTYHRRSAVALVTSLKDPFERHQSVTVHLLTHQVAQLKALATTFLSTREGTSLSLPTKERRYQYQGASLPIPIKQQLNLHMRARQLACIQASKLHLALKGNSMFLDDLNLRSHLRPQAPPPNISHPHQLHYQTAYGPRHNWLPLPHISQRKIHCLWETTQKQIHSSLQNAHHSPN